MFDYNAITMTLKNIHTLYRTISPKFRRVMDINLSVHGHFKRKWPTIMDTIMDTTRWW